MIHFSVALHLIISIVEVRSNHSLDWIETFRWFRKPYFSNSYCCREKQFSTIIIIIFGNSIKSCVLRHIRFEVALFRVDVEYYALEAVNPYLSADTTQTNHWAENWKGDAGTRFMEPYKFTMASIPMVWVWKSLTLWGTKASKLCIGNSSISSRWISICWVLSASRIG